MHSGLERELGADERSAFRARFSRAMDQGCKSNPLFISDDSQWLKAAQHELEQEKPVMTAALALNLNRAAYGFQSKMQDWMLNESKATFEARLGRTSSLPP